jgi:hemerythrin superfamily protein
MDGFLFSPESIAMNDTVTNHPDLAAGSDALSLLANDHGKVDGLFAEYEAAREGDSQKKRNQLALTICRELTTHAAIEEQLFYPSLLQAGVHHALLDRAHEEHTEAKAVVTDIQAMIAEGRDADWKVGQLIRSVRAHVAEEESELFEAARQAGVDVVALGRQLEERKQAMIAERVGESPLNANAGDNVSGAAASL